MDGLNEALDGLTQVELDWRPAPSSNSIAWQVWHMARVEDRWVNMYLKQSVEVWIADGWHKRLGLQPEDHGANQTAEEAVAMPAMPIDLLMDYYKAVRVTVLDHLAGLSGNDLGNTFPHPTRGEGPTVAWVLAHLIVEEAQHLGQVAYLRGILRGLGK